MTGRTWVRLFLWVGTASLALSWLATGPARGRTLVAIATGFAGAFLLAALAKGLAALGVQAPEDAP